MTLPYRNKELPSFDSPESDDPYAMIFVVNDSKNDKGEIAPEREIFQASVDAFLDMFLNDSAEAKEAIENWLDGRIRKIVKRARNAAWDKTNIIDLPTSFGEFGEASVKAFAPVRLSEQPAELRKLQVTGLDSTDKTKAGLSPLEESWLSIYVDENLHMTTGKVVAQINHTVQLFLMYGNESKVDKWLNDGNLITVTRTLDMPNPDEMDSLVHDAGFTEVPAGSLTAAAIFQSN